MKVRIIGAVVALVVAIAGTLLVVAYVSGADQRAARGAELVPVYVVKTDLPVGSTADVVGKAVEVRKLPRAAIQPGRVTDLKALGDKLTNAELLAGEQLVAGRFSSPDELAQRGDVPVPDGLEQVTVALDVQRAAGGQVTAGSKVGVILTAADPSGTGTASRLVFQSVLVTRVQAGTSYSPPSSGTGSNPAVASDSSKADQIPQVMVTLALSPQDATRIAWADEGAAKTTSGIWLTLQNDKTATPSADTVTSQNVLQ